MPPRRGRAAPELSIVIPVYREMANINGCLEHLRGQPGIESAEVIVVDGREGSTLEAIRRWDNPFALRAVVAPKGRGRQLNAGAEAARGQILLFLHVDTLLPLRALSRVRRALDRADVGAFSLGVAAPGALLRLWLKAVNLRKALSGTPYGDQGYFLRRELFLALGGFREIPIMEDVELMRRVRRRGLRLEILSARVLTSDRRWRRRGYLANFLRNALLYLLFHMGVPAERLARLYRPNYDKVDSGS